MDTRIQADQQAIVPVAMMVNAVDLVIFRAGTTDAGMEVLLTRRVGDCVYRVPGGSVLSQESTIEAAASQTLLRETGITDVDLLLMAMSYDTYGEQSIRCIYHGFLYQHCVPLFRGLGITMIGWCPIVRLPQLASRDAAMIEMVLSRLEDEVMP